MTKHKPAPKPNPAPASSPPTDGAPAPLVIESAPIDSLTLDPANLRLHPEASVDAIRASLLRFGQQKPIVVGGDGIVVAGNGTVTAARALGWTHLSVVRTKLTGTEAVAFAIADNRTAEVSEWDKDALVKVVAAMKDEDGELTGALGFDEAALAGLVAAAGGPISDDGDETPELPEDPVSKLGDQWHLGDHRVRCGDSTSEEGVAALLGGAKPRLMVTDPPYGVEYDASWRAEVNGDKEDSGRAVGKVENDDRADWTEAWKLFEGDVAYVWHAGMFSPVVADSLLAADLERRYLIIWAKQRHTFGRGHYHHQHEPCWMVVRKGKTAGFIGDRKQTTLWEVDNNRTNDTGHSTQKPLECMARPMRNHNAPEVYDPFLGSGTTLIAAELLGRTCYGMELSPAYVDVIVQRWQNRTGKRATHAETGEPFPVDPVVKDAKPAAPAAPTS